MALETRLNRWLGLAAVVVFLATGQYMIRHRPPVDEMEQGLRLLYRSRHVYILFGGLLNLLLGLVPPVTAGGWRRAAAAAGALLVAAAPVLLVAAFYVDTGVIGQPSPLGLLGVEAAFGGCLLAAAARLGRR